MVPSPTGKYILVHEHEYLESVLKAIWNSACECFKQIEARELSASDAEKALATAIEVGAGYRLSS